MAPVQLQNGHKDIMAEENTTTFTTSSTTSGLEDPKYPKEKLPKNESCTVCGKVKPNDIVDLSANEIMKDTLTNYYKMTKFQIKDTLSSLCVQCVYKINIQREMARTLELRLHQRSNGHSIFKKDLLKTPELRSSRRLLNQKASPNHCQDNITNNSNSVPDFKLIKSKKRAKSLLTTKDDEQLQEKTLKSSSDSNHILDKKNKNYIFGDNGRIPSSTTLPPQTLSLPKAQSQLEIPHQEQSQLELDLERQQYPHSHPHLYHHEQSQPRPRPPPPPSESKSLEEIENDENTSMLEILCERPESVLLTESGHFLNRYNTANEPNNFVCSNCGKPYWRQYFYKKHIRRCTPRYPYTKSTISNDGSKTKTNCRSRTDKHDNYPMRISKARSERVYYCGYCDVTKSNLQDLKTHQETHLPHFECPNCNEIFNTAFAFEFHVAECISKKEALDEQNEENESPRKERHRTRSVSRALSRVPDSEFDTSIEEDIDDDVVSIADSTYTQRMHTTSDWIDALDDSSHWDTSQNDYNYYDSYCDDIQLTSYKEYDLYLLDIFKLQVECSFFRCLENGCDYRAYELLDAILHDYKEHWNHSWYFCRKCGCMFTRKVHLDYHLYHQNSGRYICFKCTEVFLFQHELDRHLILHAKCVNYRCNYCQLEFLSEMELEQHCDLEQHDPNEEKTLVHIDQSMTISNICRPMTATPTSNPMCHNIRIIEMHLPKIPSKHDPFEYNRHIIGDFEFKNQIIPNCAGWKYED